MEKPVSEWMKLTIKVQNSTVMMQVLAHPKNRLMVPGKPTESPFVVSLIAPGTTMGKRYAMYAADAFQSVGDHKRTLWTWYEIVYKWVEDGCPMAQQEGHTFSLFPPMPVQPTKLLPEAVFLKNDRQPEPVPVKHVQGKRHIH